MIVYLLIILLMIIAQYVTNKINSKGVRRDAYLVFFFLICFIVSSIRSFSVGTDTYSYIEKYRIYGSQNISFVFRGYYELLYGFINWILYQVMPYERIILIFNALSINLLMVMLIRRYSRDYFLSSYIYITLLGFTLSLNGSRQYLAGVIAFMSIEFIQERKVIKFLVVIMLATFIHSSALLFIPFYFLYNMRYSMLRGIAVSFMGFLIYKSLYLVFEIMTYIPAFSRYQRYSTYEIGGRGRTFIVSLFIIIIASIFYSSKRITRYNKNKFIYYNRKIFFVRRKKEINVEKNNLYDLYYWILLFSTLAYLFAIKIYMFIRIAEMFAIVNILLIPEFINEIESSRNKKVIRIIMYIFVTLHLLFAMLFTHMQKTIPFTF